MRIDVTKTTPEILREIGYRLKTYRLQQNRSVESLAHDAGLGVRTVARAEAGEHPTLETIIKLLRALGRIDALETFLPLPLVSPLQLATSGHERQRARSPRHSQSDSQQDAVIDREPHD